MVYPNGAFRVTQYIVLDHARWCENNISLSRIYTFVFSCCFKTHHQIKYLSAWLCKMFLSVSLPCPALIIATPSQPSIRQVRYLTLFLVHSFCYCFSISLTVKPRPNQPSFAIFTSIHFYFHICFHFHSNLTLAKPTRMLFCQYTCARLLAFVRWCLHIILLLF